MKKIIIIIFMILGFIFLFANKNSSTFKKLLNKYEMIQFPNKKTLNVNVDSLIDTTTIDIVENKNDSAENFSWLKNVLKSKKMIFIGETHYLRNTFKLVNKIFFKLNQWEDYSLLALERPYSFSGAMDYFVGLKDDAKAKEFYVNELRNTFISYHEDYELLENIRRWNKKHPNKRLHVGGFDIEKKYKITINHLILPYFLKIEPNLKIDIENLNLKKLSNTVVKLEKLLAKAKDRKLIGKYPYITPNYIGSVLSNLKLMSMANNGSNYMKYRQKAIINNLTNLDFLGKYLKNGKIVVNAGYFHSSTKKVVKYKKGLLTEGSYFSTIYPETKGKTYSIAIISFFFSVGTDSTYKIKNNSPKKYSYDYLFKSLKDVYKAGDLSPDTPFLVLKNKLSLMDKILVDASIKNNLKPFLVNKIKEKKIMKSFKNAEYKSVEEFKKQFFSPFDVMIYHTHSPIITKIN